MLLEGLAATPEEAERLLADGAGIALEPCHHRGAVGPMAGVVSPSMWVFELRDAVHGGTACCSLNEGLGKVLRYGAYGPEVIERLRWMGAVLGPLLRDRGARATGPVDVTAIVGQMVQMGDEGHNRNRAGTLMLLRELLPAIVESGAAAADVAEVARFVGGNDHFFLNLVMPAGKLAPMAAAGVPGSTVVTAMARNGTDFGIQVSGTGDAWFTGPAQRPRGALPRGFGPDDANPDIGDSAITETARPRRLRDGRRAGDRPVRRRLGGRRAAHHAGDVRDHRWPRTPRSPCRSSTSAARRPGSTSPGSSAPASCRRSTPGWPAGSPAPDRSAPGW